VGSDLCLTPSQHFDTLYHIFKQESIQGRGTIKGRGMMKGRHLALYQIFKATVFTTKYMINAVIRHIVIIRKYFVCISWIISRVNHDLAYCYVYQRTKYHLYITHKISPVYNTHNITCIQHTKYHLYITHKISPVHNTQNITCI
jgi:hypothetical protein